MQQQPPTESLYFKDHISKKPFNVVQHDMSNLTIVHTTPASEMLTEFNWSLMIDRWRHARPSLFYKAVSGNKQAYFKVN